MTTPIPRFSCDGRASFPATALLTLACTSIRELHSHYTTELHEREAQNDDNGATEAVECLQDVELTVQRIDPDYWHELLSKRLDPKGES